jgi:hypothetical protein
MEVGDTKIEYAKEMGLRIFKRIFHKLDKFKNRIHFFKLFLYVRALTMLYLRLLATSGG